MKILYFIDNLAPGGAGRSLAAMAPYFSSAGLQLEVVSLDERTPDLRAEFEAAGAKVFAMDGSSRWTRLAEATRLVHRRGPNLVHTTLFEADLAGRIGGLLAGVPVVSSLVNQAYGREQLGDRHLARWKVEGARLIDAVTAQTVVRFHALSRDVAQVMARRLRIPSHRIDVVPRGRDPARLGRRAQRRRQEARKNLGAGADEFVVLAVARQEFQKGLDVLLDAFPIILALLPNARLYLCGRPGAATQDLEKKVAVAGPKVRTLGRRDDVPDLMCAADVVVLPSRWEGLGGVLLEAMALEAPIVASDLPAIRDVLDEGQCGRLVPPERPDELAEAILAAAQEPNETGRQLQAARRRFLERYTVDRVAAQMVSFYERALSLGTRRRRSSVSVKGADSSANGSRQRRIQRIDRMLYRSPIQAVFSLQAERELAVIAYHSIVDPDNLARQLDYLRRNSNPVSLEEVLVGIERRGLPKRAVLITFDDADRSLVQLGRQLLTERGLPAVAFVIAGHLDGDQPFWWTEVEDLARSGGVASGFEGFSPAQLVRKLKRVSDGRRRVAISDLRATASVPAPSEAQLRRAELKLLDDAGIVVGNHTMTHPCLPHCSDEQVRREITEAHAILAGAAGTEPQAFAYPNGDWDPRAERVLQELTYRAGFLFDHALVRLPLANPLRISRVSVDSTTSIERLGLILSGLHPALHRVRRRFPRSAPSSPVGATR